MTTVNKLIGQIIIISVVAIMLVFFLVFGIDAEVARMDRADGIQPNDCIFQTNCRVRR